jgi:hypothetical protein
MDWTVLVGVFLIPILIAFLFSWGLNYRATSKLKAAPLVAPINTDARVNLEPFMESQRAIYALIKESSKAIEALPNKTLQSIQGSANNGSGKLGELIQLIKLKDTYDRLIPLGSVSDFMGIRFATDSEPGQIHFVEVKANRSSLSVDQRKFKSMLDSNNTEVVFKTVKVEIS